MDLQAIALSFELAGLTTLILLFLGLPLGYWLANTPRRRARVLIEALVALPLVLPPTVLGFYVLLALGPESPIGRAYERLTGGLLPFSFEGLLVASVLYSLPFSVQPFATAFAAVDPRLVEGFLGVLFLAMVPIRRWLMARGLVPRVGLIDAQADQNRVSASAESGTANAAQQGEGVLSGQVSWLLRDGRTEIITGRSVELYRLDQPGKRVAWKVTDKEGRFRFSGLSPGEYRLRAFYAGSAPLWNVTVRVSPNEETTIALTNGNSTASGNNFSRSDR